MAGERWRCFVAVPVPDELSRALHRSLEPWRGRPDLAGLRWSSPQQRHVTLAFLGGVDSMRVPDIVATVTAVARRHEPMRLVTGGVGAFPSAGRARVVWYGVADPDDRLGAMARDVANVLGLDGRERFRPHITLARAGKGPVDVRPWRSELSDAVPSGVLDVAAVDLMRSHLGADAARYETLATMPLRGPGGATA